ncbi:MAG: alpha-mannosidase [Clostridia bacterium]|nr:alpha-mannosidase [Clostridia bacterium]
MDNQMMEGIRRALRAKMRVSFIPAENLTWCYAEHVGEAQYELQGDWQPVTPLTVLPYGTAFVRGTVTIPADLKTEGDYVDYLHVDIPDRQGHIIINGEHYHGHDRNRKLIPLRPEWAGQTLSLEILSYDDDRDVINAIGVERIDKVVESYLFSFELATDVCRMENEQNHIENTHIRVLVNRATDLSIRDLDVDASGEELHESVKKADAILKEELAKIDDGDVRGWVNFIGHTHIDVAWLWQLKDTVRKCGHTFTSMLRLMEEYPEFTFSCSQLQLMDYTKKYYPEVFAQIKERVKEGRWEIVGPMWVESDCNVVSGESLVRQNLYGVRFSEQEFGTRSHVAWLPDTFGFQANMPQILKKSGTDFFYTYKLHWQRHTSFPYGMFRWQGLDGSEIVCSFANNFGCYNGNPTPREVRGAKERNLQSGTFDDVIFPYGHGDGGGGPTRDMIEYATRMADYPGLPKTRMVRADEYFARLNEKKDELPTWFGELYIETHRGTMTTEGKIKRANRMAEIMYQNAEKLGVWAELLGAKANWDLLHEGWKTILLLQFHDILPGSSIHTVYSEDCEAGYAKIFSIVKEFTDAITAQVGSGVYAACNFLAWTRDAVCEFTCAASAIGAGETLVDCEGNAVPCSISDNGDGTVKVVFEAKALPPMGMKAYKFAKAAAVEGACAQITEADGKITLETAQSIVEIDELGRISRLYDKNGAREAITAPANDIRIFRDGPQGEDAWNIYELYKERPVNYDWNVTLKVTENSAFRAVVHVEKSVENCVISQDIVVYKDSPVVDFRTHIDWKIRHQVMRVYFPTNVKSQMAAYESGFGTLLRPTIANTPFDQAKFEVCAHKFADLSEGDYGVSIMNDCKYAHDCVENTLGITLLRGTSCPDELADLGEHDINYAIYPHTGDWRIAKTARKGHEFNNNVTVVPMAATLAADLCGKGLVSVDNDNVIVDTFKRAEDGKGYIVRFYEANGNRGNVTLSFAKNLKAAAEVNLLEEEATETVWSANAISCGFTPYEIKTFRIEF